MPFFNDDRSTPERYAESRKAAVQPEPTRRAAATCNAKSGCVAVQCRREHEFVESISTTLRLAGTDGVHRDGIPADFPAVTPTQRIGVARILQVESKPRPRSTGPHVKSWNTGDRTRSESISRDRACPRSIG